MKKITLKRNEDRRIKNGHLWVFSNEIDKIEEGIGNGDLVVVLDSKDGLIGTGFYNKNSLIAVRILSSAKIENLKEDFRNKLLNAYQLRKKLYPSENSFRLSFSESDYLPGLIIDKYNNTYVLQIYSFGMEKNISLITDILKEEFNAENIFSKNEDYFRTLEGLPTEDKIYLGEIKNELINDGAVNYLINFEKEHKTGFYFDQRDNRFFVERLSNGKTVLDAFCNSGGFGLHSAKAGAAKVTFVDSSAYEIESAKENFALNNLINETEFIEEDVFNYLEKTAAAGTKFDIVIVDPPAFAKSRKNIPTAKKGYERLNKLALQCVSIGGYLVTSSCSYHITRDDFISAVSSASVKAARPVQLIYFNSASMDHPKLPAMPETSYLKFGVFRVNKF
jgi:23S rRNA (cytosine1962-C5)-methyltransferase